MDKLIAGVKAVEAVCAGLVATFMTGADLHNPVTWLAAIYSIGQGLNSIFHWNTK